MFDFDWQQVQPHILQLETEGLATRTFRRLDPERQGRILNAILAEASEHGPASINIKRVAQRAGVSVGSLYQYFPNRDGMLDFAAKLCGRYVNESFNQYRQYLIALPIRQALTAYLTGGIEWSQSQTGFVQLFARAAYQGDPELADTLVRPIATQLREMVHEMLVEAAKRGEIRTDLDLEVTTRVIHTLMIAVGDGQLLPYLNNYFQIQDPAISPERLKIALIDLILDGIGKGH